MSNPSVKQIAPLTAEQIDQFKRDGILVLPAVLDPELCCQARDEMWETIESYLPRMKRDDPSTWYPITEEETTKLRVRPEGEATRISAAVDTGSQSAMGHQNCCST